MLNLVFLPVTAPGDMTYGSVPKEIAGQDAVIRDVSYPGLVWYNASVREEAIKQIRNWEISSLVLVGFSKSGLGAWNIAREIPGLVRATIIFDAPVGRETPAWEIDTFYCDATSWQADLPMRTVQAFADSLPQSHQLVLVSGDGYHEEMSSLSLELNTAGLDHVFLPRPHMKHHWNSGWIEEGVNALVDT